MGQPARLKFRWWYLTGIAVAMAGMWAFLEDIIKADWVAWAVPPLFVIAFCGVLWRVKTGSFARDLSWFVALLILAFVSIYDVLDLVLAPIIRSDWLIAGAAILVLAGLWTSLSAVIAVEEG